jgi:hypothetical protein
MDKIKFVLGRDRRALRGNTAAGSRLSPEQRSSWEARRRSAPAAMHRETAARLPIADAVPHGTVRDAGVGAHLGAAEDARGGFDRRRVERRHSVGRRGRSAVGREGCAPASAERRAEEIARAAEVGKAPSCRTQPMRRPRRAAAPRGRTRASLSGGIRPSRSGESTQLPCRGAGWAFAAESRGCGPLRPAAACSGGAPVLDDEKRRGGLRLPWAANRTEGSKAIAASACDDQEVISSQPAGSVAQRFRQSGESSAPGRTEFRELARLFAQAALV